MGLTRKQIVMLAVLVFGTFVTVLNQYLTHGVKKVYFFSL